MYDTSSDTDLPDTTSDTCDILPVTAVPDGTDIPVAQRQCPDFTDIIKYLETGSLPDSDVTARSVIFNSEQHAIIDDTLYRLHTPRQKRKDKVYPVIQQLCLPRIMIDDVTNAYHDNNTHIEFDKLYESIRSKYYWPRMFADLSEYVRSCLED